MKHVGKGKRRIIGMHSIDRLYQVSRGAPSNRACGSDERQERLLNRGVNVAQQARTADRFTLIATRLTSTPRQQSIAIRR
jgi:hypothetical protein